MPEVTSRTLRHCDSIGLLTPARPLAGRRLRSRTRSGPHPASRQSCG